MMNASQLHKKLETTIKSAKCKSQGCLSGGSDNLEIVWFGKQYQQKVITCSSCYMMNEEAIKKSLPISMNVLPVSAFLNKFVSEARQYEQNRSSTKWEPVALKNSQKQHIGEIQNFQCKLIGTLKSLTQALQGFTKKVVEANQNIYNNAIFNDLIMMYSNSQMEESLKKMQILIKYLNYGEEGTYRFDDLEYRQKKIKKLSQKIDEVTIKTLKVLDNLLQDLQQKNGLIAKI